MSSFRKRNVQKPIAGTRTSPQTGQIITSSGVPSLDMILGGGLPIGSICLIEEDEFVTNAKVLAKYFLAEGVASRQAIFLGSLDDVPSEVMRKLPKPLDNDEIEKESANTDADEAPKNGLRIAWRYNDLPMINSEQATTKIGHHFNLMEQIDPLQLKSSEITLWNNTEEKALTSEQTQQHRDEELEHTNEQLQAKERVHSLDDLNFLSEIINESLFTLMPLGSDVFKRNAPLGNNEGDQPLMADQMDVERDGSKKESLSKETCSTTTTSTSNTQDKSKIFGDSKYLSALMDIQALLSQDEFVAGAMGKKSLARICITSLGSPMWYDEQFGKDLLKFMTILRASVRNAYAVCFLTMPMHLISKYDDSLVPKIRNLVDYSIELESFAGSEKETNPAFKEYSGLLHLRKVSAINSLCVYMPDTPDLAFKLRRKKFVIEKLHLPPELQESSSDTSSSQDNVPSMSCSASSSNASLDF